ncbi:MAG: (P)ppGpp synthetase I, SpoT/RelA [Parcubacteria group bacterium GW2011_GWA2_42_28]|nr:MAG: (P)ppGpp synthetase I, SpoT/RelA [Parcubacteria group bacterium GW2011_GWA2_42_28]
MYTAAEAILNDVKKLLKDNFPDTDLNVVDQAYEFAKHAHEGQFRLSGRPHIDHAIATGQLLASWRMPPNLVIAGILHDVSEDTEYTVQDIEEHFGQDVRSIVEGETKLSTLHYRGRERYAENLRKMFFAIAKDVRVVMVKFADRIDNLKTLNFFQEEKQQRIARESIEIYAAVANRLGMSVIKGELEDLAFKYIHPKEYEWVLGLVQTKMQEREGHIEKTKNIVEEDLQKNNIEGISIHGRVKHLYSLYKKLLEKDRDISKIYDIIAKRIIVPTIQDCYATLGILHQRWKPLKGRIKDYIAQPKPNGYQSLHTTVFCEDGEIVEFQIRTPEIHEEAEFGIAAHWFYTEHGKKSVPTDANIKWLKDLAEIQKNIQDQAKFLEAMDSLKIDFFRNRIFVFTPKGDVIDLPEGATPIDYAYNIHTEVGDHCTGVRINDQFVQLNTHLQSGDIVEIITDKNRKGPSSDWLDFAKTPHAREKIKEASRNKKFSGWLRDIVRKK